jgi:hypothetical protein
MFSLTLEHDTTRRIGRSVAMCVNDKEMTATFRIANTTAGTDAVWTEAMDRTYATDSQLNWPWTITKCKRMAP